MRETMRRAAPLVPVFLVLGACSSNVEERVGVSRAALTSTFDLPTSTGENHINTGVNAKPLPGSSGDPVADPGFCFLLRVRGPFAHESAFIRISVDNDEWVGDIAGGQAARIGCEQFKNLENAGNSEEGYRTFHTLTGGDGLVEAVIPDAQYRDPSFCPLTGIAGEWNSNENCDSIPTVRAVPEQQGDDAVRLAARGSKCQGQFGLSWLHTEVTAESHCMTKWSGLSNVRYAATNVLSGTGAGTSTTVGTADGVCWISRINGNLRTSAENIEIYDNNGVWYFKSTSAGSGVATCLSYVQQ